METLALALASLSAADIVMVWLFHYLLVLNRPQNQKGVSNG